MADKQTSDERLLKIIEGSGESRRPQVNFPGVKKPFGQAAGNKFNLSVLKDIFKNLKFNLTKINTGLIGLGALLTLIFIYTLLSGPVSSKSNAAYFIPADSAAVVKFIAAGEVQGSMRKNIAQENLKRDFFLPADIKVGNAAAEEGTNILEELKGFKLVGIIWSKNPEVMIEDAKDSRTYTLKKGESFNEQFKVKDISRNSATLVVVTQAGPQEYVLR